MTTKPRSEASVGDTLHYQNQNQASKQTKKDKTLEYKGVDIVKDKELVTE